MVEAALLKRLWPDMCAAYRDPDLAKACFGAQEQWQADVPLLLVLSIADRAGLFLSKDALQTLTLASEAWQETTIRPLGKIRQSMKGRFTDPAELGLREDIKRLELEAERLHVHRIAALLPDLEKGSTPSAPLYLALRGAPPSEAATFISIFDQAYEMQVVPAPALD